MPRKAKCNHFCCLSCKHKHEYKNEKIGYDSIEKVIREDNGVEIGESAERKNNNEKNQKVRKKKKKKRKMRDLK
eukprot:14670091-Ditylum_brightwellii.AAC.1